MVEYYKPKPLEERSSQHVGAKEGVVWFGKLAAVGLGGWLAGWSGAKIYGKPISSPKFIKNLIPIETLTPKMIGMIGAKIAVIGKLFLMWRKQEAARIGTEDAYTDMQAIAPLHRSNEDLQKDNTLVKKMIAFEQEQQDELNQTTRITPESAEHHGMLSEKRETGVRL